VVADGFCIIRYILWGDCGFVGEGREGGREGGGREGGPLLTGTVEYDAVAVTVSYLMMGVLFDWFVKLRVRLGYVNGG